MSAYEIINSQLEALAREQKQIGNETDDLPALVALGKAQAYYHALTIISVALREAK